jgi:hypothetical protein
LQQEIIEKTSQLKPLSYAFHIVDDDETIINLSHNEANDLDMLDKLTTYKSQVSELTGHIQSPTISNKDTLAHLNGVIKEKKSHLK